MSENLKSKWRPLGGWTVVICTLVLYCVVPLYQIYRTGEVQDIIYSSFFTVAGLLGGGLIASRSYEKKQGLTD